MFDGAYEGSSCAVVPLWENILREIDEKFESNKVNLQGFGFDFESLKEPVLDSINMAFIHVNGLKRRTACLVFHTTF